MDQIGFDLAGQTSKVEGQFRQIAPAKLALSARPEDLLNLRGDRPILHLSRPALEADVKDFILRLRQRVEEAVVVRGIVEGEVDDFQGFKFQVSRFMFLMWMMVWRGGEDF